MLPQSLHEVIRKARPDWTGQVLTAVQAKLEQVGVSTIEDLELSLDEHLRGHINFRFQQQGLKTFTPETLQALKRALKGLQQDEPEPPAPPAPPRLPERPAQTEVVPVVAQRCNVSIEGEALISKSNNRGWGVVLFAAPADFVLAVQFTRDAGPLAEPWDDYVLVGLVPSHVTAAQIAASDQPWDWGIWVAPGTSPLQLWNRTRNPQRPIQVSAAKTALRAGQTLQLKRNVHGMVGMSVDDQPAVKLPASACWANGPLQPCVLLGRRTEVKVWITLFSAGMKSPEGGSSPVARGGGAEEAASEEPGARAEDGREGGAEAPAPEVAEARDWEPEHEPGQDRCQDDLGSLDNNGERPDTNGCDEQEEDGEAVSEQEVQQLLASQSPEGQASPKAREERFEELKKAKKSKKYSVGDLVSFFEKQKEL
mmetsp:Transcript_50422/g.146318  ORF Transcript_50422/g.146318 Transcript_50422/m.146318 type:complete len:424 (+) Transcript_50422:81-1352(+)